MSEHNVFYTTGGVFVFGCNDDGQLGLGDKENRYEPTKLEFFDDLEILSIHYGSDYTIINTKGGLFVFGRNDCGQLGLGDKKNKLVPTKLEFFDDLEILSIHCGFNHTILYTTEGLFVFGSNSCGQLGLGDKQNRLVPTKLEFFESRDLEILSISCGYEHTIITTTNGLFVFGSNTHGQLGLGDIYEKVKPRKLNFNKSLEIILLEERKKRIKSCMSFENLFCNN